MKHLSQAFLTSVLLITIIVITPTTATFSEFDWDLSNLDLSSHKFFKNFPDLNKHPKANVFDHISQHFEKKKAVGLYFGRLLFGTPQDNEVVQIEFDPNFGHAWRPHYQRRYGFRGENFIKSIGKGQSPIVERRNMSPTTSPRKREWATKLKATNSSKTGKSSNFRIVYA